MTKEEFLSKRNAIQEECKRRLEELDANYADENKEVSVGDVITDGKIIIMVEVLELCHFTQSYGDLMPCYNYLGAKVKRDGTKRKNSRIETVYGRKSHITILKKGGSNE